MAQTKTEADQDPSIEEILQSIRQIISEDDDAPADTEQSAIDMSDSGRDDADTSDVDLTPAGDDVIDGGDLASLEEEKLPASTFAAADDSSEDDILDLTEKLDDDVDDILNDDSHRPDITLDDIQAQEAEEMAEEKEPVVKTPAPVKPEKIASDVSKPQNDAATLLSEKTQNAAMAALGKLAGNMHVERQDHVSGITLEDITRELMRPMLKDWLDQNLPDLIEKIVQKEIQKISKNLD